MGKDRNKPPSEQNAQGVTGEPSPDSSRSEAWKRGRRLVLEFTDDEVPVLTKIAFKVRQEVDGRSLEKDHPIKGEGYEWKEVAPAFALLFVQYLIWDKNGRQGTFYFSGKHRDSMAASLGDAFYKDNPFQELFSDPTAPPKHQKLILQIFDGYNVGGRSVRQIDRRITVSEHFLPPDCVAIFWDARGKDALTKIEALQLLANRLRASFGLPDEPAKSPSGEASAPPNPPKTTPDKPKEPSTAFELGKLQDETTDAAKSETKSPEPEKTAPPTGIDARLFEIQHPDGFAWDDQDGLLNFGDTEADNWRIRDASEGLLIFGAVGSGKTSGSGSAFARAFLQAGYGGLILTAKPDEARRWIRLCEQAGRTGDCIHVTPGSGHKLNILQYESKRPGDRLAITDDLISLFRCLIAVMSRSKRHGVSDDFWSNSTNQLMRMVFEVFLLSGEPLTIDGLIHFIHVAPLDLKKPWQEIPHFADLLARAQANVRNGTDDDRRIFAKVLEYWTLAYPKITDATRSGIITGFTAMAETLGGRGIHELIATETNLTPEMILSGKIVILDFPVKESVQGGRMVQAAWKLLFQQAIERRTDKGRKEARPVFLWEDEGHLFFSQHDVDFQPTARDCRAAHVIISQNIHNFLHQGHDPHAVYAVFSAINTNIFHTNGDTETNRWASERIGKIRTNKLTTSGLLKPFRAEDYTIFERRPEDIKNIGGFQWDKRNEPAFEPEEFSKLKRGGDGTCQAVILWLAHQFADNANKNFHVLTFEQEPR